MDHFNGIYDIFRYNILIQKFIQGSYRDVGFICVLFIIISLYNKIHITLQSLYILYLRFTKGYYGIQSNIYLDGQYITKHTNYSVKIKTLMSDNFRAMWEYILKSDNESIYNLCECYSQYLDDYSDTKEENKDLIFIVEQKLPFEIDKDIYCSVEIYDGSNDDNDRNSNNNNNHVKVSTKKFTLTIFSFKYNVQYLKKYIKSITTSYLKSIEDKRKYLRFHYKLKNIDRTEREILWYENEFTTNKSFDKLFIYNKDEIIKKINFFLENEEWYKKEGHPYTLGIGLYGPPGTGKTSFIKSLAKLTKRHIVEISLSKIVSENDLYDVYYDNKYHKYNKEAIDFKNKIIIFEDVDCANDIVLKREYKKGESDLQNLISNVLSNNENDENDEKVTKKYVNYPNTVYPLVEKQKSDLKLSSLLNIMDGISEDNGRILIMTSNCWDKLDPALTRPGRIDIEIELGNINEEVLNLYSQHCYNKNIPKNKLKRINLNNITPCIMINEQMNSKDINEFTEKLSKY